MESDENRFLIAYEICRRFLGIQTDIKINDDKTSNNDMMDNNDRTELNNINQMNNVISPKHHSNEKEIDKEVDEYTGDDLVVDILNDELISQVNDKLQGKENIIFNINLTHIDFFTNSNVMSQRSYLKELPRYQLTHVFNTLTGASKELFESCFQSVKSYLAGEPFSEFECSMFFHR